MTRDRQAALVLVIVSSIYLIFSYRIPSFEIAVMDSDALPIGLGWLLLALSIALFFFGEKKEDNQSQPISRKEWGVIGAVLGSTLVYVFLLEWLGYILVTIPFILGVTALLGYRRWMVNVAVAVGFTGITYYAFNYLLNIYLPQGILPF
ncbi:tripartite tricarboxylate transporter TctB family protein [Desmospora activa]|uniref:Putative tricarboxylic transport membrane protein n=1 Tax=Desmospora activa DSM 45169 TaxID=1121389 RepID=A0A2T4ZCZ8_9BACL|nr:tripartite tricarboxylate transporter TctB family protein [Desmospora activa]PTM59757.1 putative tricarboxylic transport membrane protein [Desmospora activa DSM 45169]